MRPPCLGRIRKRGAGPSFAMRVLFLGKGFAIQFGESLKPSSLGGGPRPTATSVFSCTENCDVSSRPCKVQIVGRRVVNDEGVNVRRILDCLCCILCGKGPLLVADIQAVNRNLGSGPSKGFELTLPGEHTNGMTFDFYQLILEWFACIVEARMQARGFPAGPTTMRLPFDETHKVGNGWTHTCANTVLDGFSSASFDNDGIGDNLPYVSDFFLNVLRPGGYGVLVELFSAKLGVSNANEARSDLGASLAADWPFTMLLQNNDEHYL